MKSGADGQAETIEKASKLLSASKTLYLATNGMHGHPNIRAMAPAKVDGVKSIWFVTFAGSSKVQELLKDGHAVIYAEAPRAAGECRFWGNVEVLDDAESKNDVWREEFREHGFPDGPSSEHMRVLRFNISNGVYADKNFETFEFKN